MAYDEDGCQTCRCVRERPACPQCICPVGFQPRSQDNCDACECERIERLCIKDIQATTLPIYFFYIWKIYSSETEKI